jgi:hypothetical protein
MENKKSVAQEVRETNYNPFSQNVNEKPYTKINVGVDPEQLSHAIPEPQYSAQQLGGTNPYDNLGGDGMSSGSSSNDSKGGDSKPINPSMSDLSPHERKQAAEHLADLAISGYEMLHVFGNKALQVSKSKIKKLVAKEVIDLEINVPFGNGTITAEQFIEQYNEEVSDALSVSSKFKKDVRPPLVKVLEKRGLGATDEQQLFTIVIMDLVTKGGVIYQALGTQKEMIRVIQERTEFEKANGYGTAPIPVVPKTENAPPKTKTYTAPKPDMDADDFNFKTNETVMNATVQKMQVPNTGKLRSMAQRQKEKVWSQNAEKADMGYAEAILSKKTGTGKRGRPKKENIDSHSIAESIIIKENDKTDYAEFENVDN